VERYSTRGMAMRYIVAGCVSAAVGAVFNQAFTSYGLDSTLNVCVSLVIYTVVMCACSLGVSIDFMLHRRIANEA